MKIKWPWTVVDTTPPGEDTQQRHEMLQQQRNKLRRAEVLASSLADADRVNHYAQRIRKSYENVIAQEAP